ncbi:MAG: DNA repair exonuclease [Eubacterium sp.]
MRRVSFIHTGDLHMGRQFHFNSKGDIYGKNKRLDLWETFEKILNTAEKNKINLLLISGDLFDSDEVDMIEVERVAEKFGRLTQTHVVISAGNHDSYSSVSLYGLIDWPENVTLFKTGKLESVSFPDLETEVYGMSWIKKNYSELPFCPNIPLDPSRNNIMMLHGDAYAKRTEYLPIQISDFKGFDYLALGHIHKPDILTKTAAYCGSPEGLNFGEGGTHGVIVGQIKDHECISQFVPIQKREYIDLSLEVSPEMSFDGIKEAILSCDTEEKRKINYYRIHLKGYRDPGISMDWLEDELRGSFYYFELDDKELEIDLDIELLLKENRDNIIGKFIQEILREDKNALSKKALYYGLEGILKEKVIL